MGTFCLEITPFIILMCLIPNLKPNRLWAKQIIFQLVDISFDKIVYLMMSDNILELMCLFVSVFLYVW